MRIRKLVATGLTAAMLGGVFSAASAADSLNTPPSINYDGIVLGKQATPFSGWNTNVTLDVVAPVNSEPIAVQFVLDATESLFVTEDNVTYVEAWAKALKTMENKNIYAGLTYFTDTAATPLEPTLLTKGLLDDRAGDLEKAALAAAITGRGTNVQSGIREGLKALDGLSADLVKPENRYLILITDGGSFFWMNGDKAVNNSYAMAGGGGASMLNADAAEPGYDALRSLESMLATADDADPANDISAEPVTYGSAAAGENLAAAVQEVKDTGAYTNFEKGVYFAAEELDSVAVAGVKLVTVGYPYYADDSDVPALTALAAEFIDYAQSKSVASYDATLASTEGQLDEILSSIYGQSITLAVPAGSVITDFLGYDAKPAKPAEPYNFDLNTSEPIRVALSNAKGVEKGGLFSSSQVLDENGTATFKDGEGEDFLTVVYTPAEDGNEKLTITLHQDLLRSQKLSITYSARLTAPCTTEGIYTVYTNVNAYLNPKTGEDDWADLEKNGLKFPRPALRYVRENGGTDKPDKPDNPQLNTDDHFAYIIGRDDGLVHPEAPINRAEVTTIFFRMLTDDSRNDLWYTENPYSDVDSEDWFNNGISTLTHAGIVKGRPGNVFAPDEPITRAEFATIAVRFFGGEYEGDDLFTDISGHWANPYINRAAVLGLINGRGDGRFDPDANITRAEAMAIVNRTLGRAPHVDHLLNGMIIWPDNLDTSAWYYADVQEATNSHDFKVITVSGKQVEGWTELLPVRDWAALERAWSNANSSKNPGDVMPELDN